MVYLLLFSFFSIFYLYRFLILLNLLVLNYLTSGSALNIPAASLRDAADMFFAVAGRIFLLGNGILDDFLKCVKSNLVRIGR